MNTTRKMICSICLLLTAVALVVIKEYGISAQDNNRPVVLLDGELVYEDTLNRSDIRPERVKREAPVEEPKRVEAPKHECRDGVCIPNTPLSNVLPAAGEAVQIPASMKEIVKDTFAPVAPQSQIASITTDASFATEVESCKGIVFVDFYATWCGPCQRFMPVVESVMPSYSGMVKFTKVDVDVCSSMAKKYSAYSLPCVLIFKDGVNVENHIGSMSDEDLRAFVNRYCPQSKIAALSKPKFTPITTSRSRSIVILDGHRVYEDTLGRPSSEVERVEDPKPTIPTEEKPEDKVAEAIDLKDEFADVVDLENTKSTLEIDYSKWDQFFTKSSPEFKPFDFKTKWYQFP
jgi:thioredoxin 1